ncbi:MAG: long-chain fatty acid--CoA ligase, partial [candidate division Zixibacteria bacterium]|nr:long-chain fatty acid--CoA ligase [candidate division Zixibacteria bacterium]
MAQVATEQAALAGTIPDLIDGSIRRSGADQSALIADGGEGERISYAELGRRIGAVAGGLNSLGVRRGECVALLSENRPEWAISYLAILSAGATVVPLDALLKPEEHMTLLQESCPTAIIISSKFLNPLQKRLHESLPDITVITIDDADSDGHSFVKLLAFQPYTCTQIDPDQTAALIFTSGTTGKPKAVQLTHRNISSNIESIFRALEFSPRDRFLSVLPLSHVYECTAGFLTALAAGASITYARSLAAPSLVEDLRNNEITILVGVPLLFEKMRRGFERKIKQAPFVRRALFAILYQFASFSKRVGAPLGKSLFAGLRKKAGMGALRLIV